MRHFRPLVTAALAALITVPVAASALPAGAATQPGPKVEVIVGGPNAAAEVVAAGGQVTLDLPLVNAVAATLPAGAAGDLVDEGLVVVPDAPAKVVSDSFDATTHDVQMAALDPGVVWDEHAGSGVSVALVDTGVAETPDLVGRVFRGPDLSGEGDGIDHYGHGTFMAGLIAGDGSASRASGGPIHTGVAPGARIVSIKVAGADGSTNLSRIIAGINFAVTHRQQLDIRVLSLSLAVATDLPYEADPLSAAVEAAWMSGVTVVAAAGNAGPGTVTSPGRDPFVLTAGAADNHGTAAVADDTIASWSGSQTWPNRSKPEVVAPGVSVVSLRAPGSTIDAANPNARIGDAYFRGSGTSMSTALTAGVAAVVTSDHPLATPDDVKGAITDGATVLAGGARSVDLANADVAPFSKDWLQSWPVAFDGLGRGMRSVPWRPGFFASGRWTNTSFASGRWTGSQWASGRWTGTGFASGRWTDATWASGRWTGTSWASGRWTGTSWASGRWTGTSWASGRWTGSQWASGRWTGTSWASGRWTGATWTGGTWTGTSWAGTSWAGTSWSSALWSDAGWS